MKKSLLFCLTITIAIISHAQSKPFEINNYLDVEISVKIAMDECSNYTTDIKAGGSEVFQLKTSEYFSITIFYYKSSSQRTVYLLNSSSVPYYSKNKSVEGTKITVKNKIGINPTSDIKYGNVNDVTRYLGCRKR